MKLHIWDLSKIVKIDIAVDIKDSFKNKIKEKINKNICSFARELKIKSTRLYEYFIWKKSVIPLDILLHIVHKIGLSKEELEKSIIMYKQLHVPYKNSIKNPELPIKRNPYFTSIIANLFFDGSVPEDGKGTYYNQKNEKIMNDFIKKVKYVFGDVFYSLRLDHKGVLKCRIPRIIGEICRDVYGVNSFGTFKARIPKMIFNFDKKHKIAFVLTAIIDEGSITYGGEIRFGVSNKKLCEDVKRLCNTIDLETTKVTRKSKSDHYYFNIKSKKGLLQIINLMNKKYPLISLRHKEDRLKHYFKMIKHPGLRTEEGGNLRKKKIIKSLKSGPKSLNQLSIKLLIPPRSLMRHADFLVDKGKLEKKKVGQEYYYHLSPH